MILLLAFYSFGGLVLAGLSVPFVLHKIRPNRWYGLHLRAMRQDAHLWYMINAYIGRRMLVVGLGTAIGANILYYTSSDNVERYALSCLGVFLALLLWGVITSFLYSRTFQEKTPESD